jgi:hypothetical protein
MVTIKIDLKEYNGRLYPVLTNIENWWRREKDVSQESMDYNFNNSGI